MTSNEDEDFVDIDQPWYQSAWERVETWWTTETAPQLTERSRQLQDWTQTSARQISEQTVATTRSIGLQTQAATAVAAAHAQHTISQIGSPPVDASTREIKGASNDGWITRMPWGLVEGTCGAAFFVAGFAFFTLAAQLVDLASFSLLLLAPYALYQRRQLRELGSLRQVHNQMRSDVNELAHENEEMKERTTRLEQQIGTLETVESKLQAYTQNTSVPELVTLVHEHSTLQSEIAHRLQQQVVQQLFAAILSVDSDRDSVLDPPEVERLKTRLSCLPGIVFHPERWPKHDGLTLGDLCAMVREVSAPQTAEPLFELRPQNVLEDTAPEPGLRRGQATLDLL